MVGAVSMHMATFWERRCRSGGRAVSSSRASNRSDPITHSGTDNFDLLCTTALAHDAVEAVVIPAAWVSVERHVALKCRTGCLGYGRKLTSPPHVPTPAEFSRILGEYRFALLVQFESSATADREVTRSLYRSWLDPSSPPERREQAARFWEEYFEDSTRILSVMLELEGRLSTWRVGSAVIPRRPVSSIMRSGST